MSKIISSLLVLLFGFSTQAQILDITPAFPNVNDVITIIYKADEGNGALTGVSPIYGHFGLITSTSTSPTNWQFVKGNWGTADPLTAMTPLGNNLHQITIDIDQFFGFTASTTVLKLAMVFRNASGSVVGRSADGTDIYYDIYPTSAGLLTQFFDPTTNLVLNANDPLNLIGKSNQNCNLTITDNGSTLQTATNSQIITYNFNVSAPGQHLVKLTATNGSETVMDSFTYIIAPTPILQDAPVGTKNGLTRLDPNTIRLKLVAPQKNHVFVLGDFNNWQPNLTYFMNKSIDGSYFWLDINGLSPNVKYGYQYLIDGNLKVADPMSELVADPNNDGFITATTYPNPYTYPTGQTTGILTQFETQTVPFNWLNDAYTRPAKKDLMIYEILPRDFIAKHDYLTLADTLNYLANLGINAIEIMPISEFEGNESWGYNPSFHMALDKYYGTPEHFKAFVDKCHSLGIAVIMDIALNHAYGQNPLAQMYWDAVNNRPAANNPWFNAICPHEPYCWGNDFNHEVQATKDYVNQINAYWLEEYHIDGYRFDFTKGFVNSSANYSATRIDLLKAMADSIWAINPEAYIILEHWSDNNEEIALSNYGMLLWGNLTYEYHQSIKGYSSNLSNGLYTSRGWSNPHLVTYIESHDEERGTYEALQFGNTSNPNHNVKQLHIALQRTQAAAVVMLTTPGPKMIWQFGELGYDYSIDYICRVCNKPIRWDYYSNNARKQLYQVYQATLHLRNTYPVFQSLNFQASLNGFMKRIVLTDPTTMSALVLANFNTVPSLATTGFPATGTWYEYYTGDSLVVNNVNMQIALQPGEYRVYTSAKIPSPNIISIVALDELLGVNKNLELYPVPAGNELHVVGNIPFDQASTLEIYDMSGRKVYEEFVFPDAEGVLEKTLQLGNLHSGMYTLRLFNGKGQQVRKFTKE